MSSVVHSCQVHFDKLKGPRGELNLSLRYCPEEPSLIVNIYSVTNLPSTDADTTSADLEDQA